MKCIFIVFFVFMSYTSFGQQDSYYFKLDLATFLFENGKQKEAISLYHELIKDLRDEQKFEGNQILLDVYIGLIDVYNELNNIDSSDHYFVTAFQLVENVNLQNNITFQYRILGFTTKKLILGDFNAPRLFLEKMLKNHRKSIKPEVLFFYFFYLSSIYMNTGNDIKLNEVLNDYENEIRKHKFEKEENFLKEIISMTSFYKFKKDFKKEKQLNEQALNISSKVYGENSLEYLGILQNHAVLHHNLNKFNTADSLFNKCILINENIGSNDLTQNMIDIYAAQINSLRALGENQRINYLSKKVFEICFDTATNLNCTTLKNNLGLYYISVGNYPKANELLSSIVNEMKEGSNIAENILYVKMQMNNAYALDKIGESTKALKIYLDCLEILDNRHYLGAEYVQLLIKVAEFGVFSDFNNAHIFIDLGLQIISKDINKFTKEFAYLSNLAGILNLKNGDINKGIELLNMSLDALNDIDNIQSKNEEIAQISHNLGVCYELKNEPSTAYENYKKHFNYLTENLRHNFSFMDENEMELNLIGFSYSNNWLKNFYYQNNYNEDFYNLELFEKDILLNTLISRKESTKSNTSYNLESDIDFAKKKAKHFNKSILLKSNEVLIEFSSFRYRRLGKWTDSIVYLTSILKPGMEKPLTLYLFEEKQITDFVNKKGIKESTNINQLYNNEYFYQIVWEKLDPIIPRGSKIYYSPSGLLNKIQPAAIKRPTGEYLADDYQFELVRSTGLIQKERKESQIQNIAIFGGMDYEAEEQDLSKSIANINLDVEYVSKGIFIQDSTRGGKWSYLPGTKQEAENIHNISKEANISVKLYMGVEAIEEQFKNMDGDKSPSILHIATHGFFFPDPKVTQEKLERMTFAAENPFTIADNPMYRSGLLFSGSNVAWAGDSISTDREDGILTAYEVSHTNLKNTELVVLSACETGLGDIKGSEGVYGLQRAFKQAGVRYLMMSLWKVPDNATKEFMTTFYTELLTNKKSIRDAYNMTQKQMREKYRNEPYKWGGFVLME